MRIGIYDPYLDTMSGGEKYMLSIAKVLEERHEVHLLWDKTTKEDIVERAKKRFAFDLSSLTFSSSPFTPALSIIKRIQQTKAYDLIIYLSDGSIPVVGCPLILHFQSPMPWVNGTTLQNKLKLSRVKSVICNSEYTKSFTDKTFGIQSKILYPPVALQRSYSKAKKDNIILNVGRFGINQAGSSYKKQDVLAETFSQMIEQGLKKWELVFVMSVMDSDKDNVVSFQKRYEGLPITFLINPSNDQLWEYYEKASIYWHASGFGEDLAVHPDRAEHFGISTVEAMGTGSVPVVVNAGGQKEIVQDKKNGRLWNSTDELIAYTLELISNKQMRDNFAEKAANSAEQFSFEHFRESVLELVK